MIRPRVGALVSLAVRPFKLFDNAGDLVAFKLSCKSILTLNASTAEGIARTLTGMFSHSDHHHQSPCSGHSTPTGGPSPTTIPADLLTTNTWNRSALATLALIHSTLTVTTNGVIPYNSHMVQVTQALARHITPCSDHTPTLLSTPTVHQRLDHAHVPAMYATAAAAHCKRSPSASLTIPVPNTTQQSQHVPVVTHEHPWGARVIVRFDLTPSQPPDQAAPISLHGAIDEVLPKAGLSGVRWTKDGNLVLVPGRHFCTGKIWMAIRPLLGLPGDYKCPVFESDERWHLVIFHGVPASVTDAPINLQSIRAWLDLDDVQGSLKVFSILSCPEDLQTRKELAIWVSLSSEEDAQRLVKNGGSFYGAQCRVTHYIPKSHAATSQ
ncbi:hypothetical protein DFH07DRAFT_939228 [Mycena maculata]|uniref:Uncharacterized protein n=1 Tax=Mycena maculata TaxID=230809 RepID=A0AAD7JF12_9AGAR|nr:hypothetical protein DFH07DRAFT_939228 [Mycena maculata]